MSALLMTLVLVRFVVGRLLDSSCGLGESTVVEGGGAEAVPQEMRNAAHAMTDRKRMLIARSILHGGII